VSSDASSVDGLLFGFAITGDDGKLPADGLRAGAYTLCFDPSRSSHNRPRYLPDASTTSPTPSTAGPHGVLSGISTTGINATIPQPPTRHGHRRTDYRDVTDGNGQGGTATDVRPLP